MQPRPSRLGAGPPRQQATEGSARPNGANAGQIASTAERRLRNHKESRWQLSHTLLSSVPSSSRATMSAPNRPFQTRANASGALSPTLSGAVSPTPNDDGVFDGAAAASAEAAAAAAAAKPSPQQRTEIVTIAPYGSPSSSSAVQAVPLSLAMNSSSRVPSTSSANHSSNLMQQQPSPNMRNMASPPSSGLASQTGDRAPLLREFNLADSSADDPNSMAADLKVHPVAAPVASAASASAAAAASTTSVYDQYEATVAKIRARRAAEAAAKSTVSRPTPERQKHEAKVVSIFLSFVTLIVALVVYFMYPRIPLWSIDHVRIEQLKLWSDGSASFQIHTDVSVNNGNFMMTGIQSIAISVSHNGTSLGAATVMDGPLKFRARQANPLSMDHNFSPVSPVQFQDLFNELSQTRGELTLDYSVAIVTSENFRLRNIQVECQCKMQVDPTPVPPVAQILLTQCSHTERTG